MTAGYNESAWLIERGAPSADIEYICLQQFNWAWTKDHNEALRFARSQDADKVIDSFPELIRGAYAAEHVWIKDA